MLKNIVLFLPIIAFVWSFYKYTVASNDCEKYIKKSYGLLDTQPLPKNFDVMKDLLIKIKCSKSNSEQMDELIDLVEGLDNAKQMLIGLLVIFIFFVYIPLAFVYFR